MKDTAKAHGLFTVGLIMLFLHGENNSMADTRQHDAHLRLDLPQAVNMPKEEAPVGRYDQTTMPSELAGLLGNPFASNSSFKTEAPDSSETAETYEYAQACAKFDPVDRPEEIADIFLYVSKVTGVKASRLYGIWQSETGNVDGAGVLSGDYPVMKELARRCRYWSAGGCRTDAHGRPVNCANANACHYFAMERMATVFNWELEKMTCSKPSINKKTRRISGYGGSCGPFQFSAAEVDHEFAIPHRLDPMTLCGGAMIVGWEVKKYHDQALSNRQTRDNDSAWRWALNRYGGSYDGHYSATVTMKSRRFQNAYDADPKGLIVLRRKLAEDYGTKWSVQYLKKYRANRPAFAKN